jgi:nucleoid DNA-binding protein
MARSHIRREQLAKRAEVAEIVVKDVFDVILAAMEEDTEVWIEGFGKFIPARRAASVTRSPVVRGGEPTERPGGRIMRFRMSPALRREWRDKVTK